MDKRLHSKIRGSIGRPGRTFVMGVFLLSLVGTGLWPAQAGAKELDDKLPPQEQPRSEAVHATADAEQDNEPAEEGAIDAFIPRLETLEWQPVPPGASRLSLKEVLKRTLKENVEIRLSAEKIDETRAKQAGVESKRLLFFFRYFDAQYIEGSAESDVSAAQKHLEAVTQQALLEASTEYADLMRAVMATYVSHQAIRQGLKQLQYNRHRFESGETTGVELMQTKTQLAERYQNFLKSWNTQEDASLRLVQFLGLPPTAALYPQDLTYHAEAFNIPVLSLLGETLLDEKTVVDRALKNRPDLQELALRKVSMDNMAKASALQFDRNHGRILESTQRQLELKLEKARQTASALALKALRDYRFAADRVDLADDQLHLASKGLRQVQISQKAGFSSNKDVLDAQVVFAQAQVNQANALIDYNLGQIRLLYETGQLSLDAILNGGKEKAEEEKSEDEKPD